MAAYAGLKVCLGQNIGLFYKNIGFYKFIWYKIIDFHRFSSENNVPANSGMWKFMFFYLSKVISTVFHGIYHIVHTSEYSV